MRAIVLGQSGQVATELQRQADRLGANLTVLGREAVDLSNPEAAVRTLKGLLSSTDAVINAAAYTAVDKAESEPEAAQALNADGPGAVARLCSEAGVPFVHVSTDYVFDGSGDAPWLPDDPTGPLGVYGRSKLDGETAVRAAGGTHAILRTSWVFSSHGANFVKTMLRLGAERDELTIVADQIGGPTPAAAIADTLLRMARALIEESGKSGTYHFSGAPDASWADFAREIMEQSGLTASVKDIPTTAFPTPAARPGNSRMDCSSLEQTFGIARPDWRGHLTEVLRDLNALKT